MLYSLLCTHSKNKKAQQMTVLTSPIQLPKFPGSEPKQLDRKQGVHYAEKVLRQLDQDFSDLKERESALRWCENEMRRVRDQVAEEHGSAGATFFEGMLTRFNLAAAGLLSSEDRAAANLRMAAHCREKAQREFNKLIAHAEALEASAKKHETYRLADARFV